MTKNHIPCELWHVNFSDIHNDQSLQPSLLAEGLTDSSRT